MQPETPPILAVAARHWRVPQVILSVSKWLGLAACLSLVAIWFIVPLRPAGYYDGRRFLLFTPTGVHLMWGWGWEEDKIRVGWHVGSKSVVQLVVRHLWHSADPRSDQVFLSRWSVLVMVSVPTALAWYFRRRRFPPGCCAQCGYNLTGNVTGRCPECGTAIPAEQRPRAGVA